ncbi:MAG: hypothetical protein WB460_12605 [Candidatus Acidiferrales bacterium]
MALGKWKLFGQYRRVYSTETYKDTQASVDRVLTTSLLLFSRKTGDEQQQIASRVSALTEKIGDATAAEIPLVVSTALLTAIRVHDEALKSRWYKTSHVRCLVGSLDFQYGDIGDRCSFADSRGGLCLVRVEHTS